MKITWLDLRYHHLRIELREGIPDGVHGAHAMIADTHERLAVDASGLPLDGVEVGEDLGGMLAPAVAGVDDGNRCPVGSLVGRPLPVGATIVVP